LNQTWEEGVGSGKLEVESLSSWKLEVGSGKFIKWKVESLSSWKWEVESGKLFG